LPLQKTPPFFSYSPPERTLPQQAVLRLREGGKVSATPQVIALHSPCSTLSILAFTFSCCALLFVISDSEIVPALSTRAPGAIHSNVNRKDVDVHLRIFRLFCKRGALIILLHRCPRTTTNMCPHTSTTCVLIATYVSACSCACVLILLLLSAL